MAIRILLADGEGIFREGLRNIVESRDDFEVAAEASDADEAIALAAELRPDVAIIELHDPAFSGRDVIEQIREKSEQTQCLVLSGRLGRAWVEEALRAGAAGYVPKCATSEELLLAIGIVQSGKCYVSPAVTEYIIDAISSPGKTSFQFVQLTKREREVLCLIADGLSSREIAKQLGMSPRTADTHRSSLMDKVGVRKAASLVRFAIREGLVVP